jgi:UPF0755 protein
MENLKNIYLRTSLLKKNLIYFSLLFIIFGFIFSLGYFLSALSPVSKTSAIKEIEVGEGESFGQIAENLETAGVIRSRTAFEGLSLLSGEAHKLKPGIYSLNTASSTLEILKNLVAGPDLEREVVIPEGLTLLDIDRKLSDAGIIEPNALANFNPELIKNNYEFLKELKSPIKSLEGYLFPDTYEFFIKSNPSDVIKKFLDNFNLKAWPYLKDQSMVVGKNTFKTYQFLTVASMIEKEVYYDAEKPIISGIIYQRINLGMPLQIDATITYAKCNKLIFYCDNPVILKKELRFPSLYNTYLYRDLPPTPISNPGLTSIIAALNPQKSDYLYYLSDSKTKKTIFSQTLAEQNKNIEKYLGLH